MRNNQLFVVRKNCVWFKTGSLAQMYYTDGSDMPKLIGTSKATGEVNVLWCELHTVSKVARSKQNLRKFDKQIRTTRKSM